MIFSFDETLVARKRIELAKRSLQSFSVDALVFFNGDRYGRKFSCTSAFTALVLFAHGEPQMIAHCSEAAHAEDESELEIMEITDTSELKDALRKLVSKRIGEPKAKVGIVSWNASSENCMLLKELGWDIVDSSKEILPGCLPKPFPEEIEAIRKLSFICDKALEAAHNSIEVGVREFEVAAEIDYVVRKLGVTEFAFPTLVASGYRSAFPHGWTSGKRIKSGDAVVVDIGPFVGSYDGCVCRTFGADEKSRWIKETEVVKGAIRGALEVIKIADKPQASEIDRIARDTIKKGGYKGFFTEKTDLLTGHPIGGFCLPIISHNSNNIIEEGMVFTIEPGIYIKGKGGVRIEHQILAKKYSYEILDRYQVEL